ncbi:flagellar export chaperone FliS [Tepidimonas charontis]|uniref:Flagellar secretion chaperone FliS n=1 Tax=Tepidimonas charontis TaxID=2267262 RepID=A0A554XK62_9BURK|nr:flagellar export chaperone FliS [Tepidimonas charontis]TSE36214.1 Flagellar protein FliS [Tepidimonas charontis]
MYTAPSQRLAASYAREAAASRVASASPHELIMMLFDGLLASLLSAKGAMERGDVAAKGQAIGKAVRILEEGLRAGLSPEGGELSGRLEALYDYCGRQLTWANLHNDVKRIDEVIDLIKAVADAWQQIRPQ